MQQQENRLRLHVLVIGWLVILAIAAVSFALGYRFGRRSYPDKTPARVIELRYNSETGWFQLWENGVCAAKYTATELGVENVPVPEGWTQRFFWVPFNEIRPEYRQVLSRNADCTGSK